MDVLKPIKDDPDNPFGSLIKEGVNDPDNPTATRGGQVITMIRMVRNSFLLSTRGQKKEIGENGPTSFRLSSCRSRAEL